MELTDILAVPALRAHLAAFSTALDKETELLAKFSDKQRTAVAALRQALKADPGTPPASDALSVNEVKELFAAANDIAAGLTARLKEQAAEINRLAEDRKKLDEQVTSFNTRVTNGDLITKDTHESALKAAEQSAVKAANERAQLLATRRTGWTQAGLPMPPDDVLAAEDEGARRQAATERKSKLEAVGLSINDDDLAWCEAGKFDLVLKAATKAREGVKAGSAGNPFGAPPAKPAAGKTTICA